MKPQDRQSYLQEMHYGPQGKPTGPALGREAALGALGTVLPETQHPLRDAATATVKDATNPSEIAKTALTSGMYPAVKMGIGLGRQLLHGAGDVAPVLGKLTPGGGFGSTITKDEAERAAHGAGEIGGTIAPAVLPEAVKPVARGAGAALENTGRFANTPLPTGIDRFRNVTPAGVVGGTAGGFIGHHLGVPVIGESGGAAAGMIGATAAAKGAETLGARLREWGGYEPPPVQRDLSGVKPLSRIPKSRMIPDLRDAPPKISQLSPPGRPIPDLRDAPVKVSPLPSAGRMIEDTRDAAPVPVKSSGPGLPPKRMIPDLRDAPREPPRIIDPTAPVRSRGGLEIPGQSYEAAHSGEGGAAWGVKIPELINKAKFGDVDAQAVLRRKNISWR